MIYSNASGLIVLLPCLRSISTYNAVKHHNFKQEETSLEMIDSIHEGRIKILSFRLYFPLISIQLMKIKIRYKSNRLPLKRANIEVSPMQYFEEEKREKTNSHQTDPKSNHSR